MDKYEVCLRSAFCFLLKNIIIEVRQLYFVCKVMQNANRLKRNF